MTSSHSNNQSNFPFSAKEMREVSQEISRNFAPNFFSRMPEADKTMMLSSRELSDINEEIKREYPAVSPDRLTAAQAISPIAGKDKTKKIRSLPIDLSKRGNAIKYKTPLSSKEIGEIGREISRNYAPSFASQMPEASNETMLSIKELLDIDSEIRREYAPKITYRTPELILLPVDPAHLYAYWNLTESRTDTNRQSATDEPLTLRIFNRTEQERHDTNTSWFELPVDSPVSRRQVTLPEQFHETVFSAAIGKRSGQSGFIEFAHSNVIHVPHGGRPADFDKQDLSSYSLSKNASGLGLSH